MTNNLSKSKSRDLSRENYLNRYIPALKIRSIATFVLQRYIPKYKSAIAKIIRENDAKHLFSSLEESRFIANKLNRDEDLAHAFQESWRSEWGDGVREVELALAAMGGNSRHKGGSEAFFLTQEAGSNMAIIHLSSLLFISWENNKGAELNHWNNRDLFAESLLLERIVDVLNKFLDSETKDSHLVDPNLWNSTRDMKSGKIILCCTSFFDVVVGTLKIINRMNAVQFDRNKKKLFPLLCSLVKVHSIEIRGLVHDILLQQMEPLL